MSFDFIMLRRAAKRERARTFNPEEAPPHGDFPYLDVRALHDLDRDANHPFAKVVVGIFIGFAIAFVALILAAILAMVPLRHAHARDLDGHYAKQDPAMHAWFDGLTSGRGSCCSNADGIAVEDVDYDTNCTKPNCHYRVRLLGEWHDVDDDALVTVPNLFGRAVVWPVFQDDENGKHVGVTYIRCFMPGAGA